jgi:hypothetical protein
MTHAMPNASDKATCNGRLHWLLCVQAKVATGERNALPSYAPHLEP